MMALPFCNGLASFSGAGDRCSVGLVGEGSSVRSSGYRPGKGPQTRCTIYLLLCLVARQVGMCSRLDLVATLWRDYQTFLYASRSAYRGSGGVVTQAFLS